jgi:hypothetical protein
MEEQKEMQMVLKSLKCLILRQITTTLWVRGGFKGLFLRQN